MTPQQEQLNNQVKELPVIENINNEVDGLKEGQDKILSTIEEEKKANKQAFDKGDKKFDDLYERVEKMGIQIKEGFDDLKKDIAQNILDGKDDEIKKLNKRLDGRDQIKNGVIITLVGGIVLYVAIYLFEILRPIGNLPPQ